MRLLSYIWIDLPQTLLRVFPFPSKTGLIRIGNPGRNSPVLLTGNFRLTVERVKRALRGTDAYLLVANSRGLNVWCASAGGHLTNHDVVSVLKTSGVEKLVDHRTLILPQLAATGVEGNVILDKTGWQAIWGPVRAVDIPAFLEAGLSKTVAMRTVAFPWWRRLEMAATWAFPISAVGGAAVLLFWREAFLPLAGLVWSLSFLMFLSYPLYEQRLRREGVNVGFVFFDFGPRGVALLFWIAFMAAFAGYTTLTGDISWALALRWGFCSLVVLFVLTIDLMGATPVSKSGLHEDRLLRVVLDEERCKGVGACEAACPRDVFELSGGGRKATLARPERCVQCGACLVQCPFDALCFESPSGEVIRPEVVRKFKLNLMGRRLVSADKRAA